MLVVLLSACASSEQETQEEINAAENGEAASDEEIVDGEESAEAANEETVAENEATPTEETAVEEPAVEEEVASAVPADAPSQSQESSMPAIESAEGRVVRYARGDARLYAAANSSGSSVGRLAKGDVVLVTYEGNWARLDNGQYVDGSTLSARGVGKARGANGWASGQ